MTYFLISLLILTVLFWILFRMRLISFCPICAATVLTWVGGLFVLYFDLFFIDPLTIAILMGASLGALAEKYGYWFGLLWKSGLVILGFLSIYFLVTHKILEGLITIAILVVWTAILWGRSETIKKADDKFKECC